MDLWGRMFAAMYDRGTAAVEEAGLAAQRAKLLASASGRVLEIGGGTGANLRYYPDRVTDLVITEPQEPMLRRLEPKLRGHPIATRVVRAPAERLPLDTGSFDCAVSAMVLCTVEDPARVLAEVRRVLKPDGRLLLIEHVRSDDPALARWQDRLRGPWAWLAHGCQSNRRTAELVAGAGFSFTELRYDALPKVPRIVSPLIVGAAARTS
jgi:ubiquinone/menaquinone biosynthesis C-methylase UbiE